MSEARRTVKSDPRCREALAAFAPFAGLSARDLGRLAAAAAHAELAPGDGALVPDGSGACAEAAFVISGRLRVLMREDDEGAVSVHEAGPGSAAGLAGAFDRRARVESAEALEPATVVILPHAALRAAASAAPKLALALLDLIVPALRDRTAAARIGRTGDGASRVFAALLRRAAPDPANGLWRIAQMPRHRELAEEAGVSAEDAAGAVALLIARGLARRRYPALEIIDRAQLTALAEGA